MTAQEKKLLTIETLNILISISKLHYSVLNDNRLTTLFRAYSTIRIKQSFCIVSVIAHCSSY